MFPYKLSSSVLHFVLVGRLIDETTKKKYIHLQIVKYTIIIIIIIIIWNANWDMNNIYFYAIYYFYVIYIFVQYIIFW